MFKYCASYVCFTFIHHAEHCVRLTGDRKKANNILKGGYKLSRDINYAYMLLKRIYPDFLKDHCDHLQHGIVSFVLPRTLSHTFYISKLSLKTDCFSSCHTFCQGQRGDVKFVKHDWNRESVIIGCSEVFRSIPGLLRLLMYIVLKVLAVYLLLCKSNEEECCFRIPLKETQSVKENNIQLLGLIEKSTYTYSTLLRKVSKVTNILRS